MICNAGVADMKTMVSLRDMNMDDYMHTFNLNFFCPVVMTKEALPHLEKTKGNIIQVSSIVGKSQVNTVLGPKLLLAVGCVKLSEKNCVHLPSVGEQTAN